MTNNITNIAFHNNIFFKIIVFNSVLSVRSSLRTKVYVCRRIDHKTWYFVRQAEASYREYLINYYSNSITNSYKLSIRFDVFPRGDLIK